jgi:hypothetical protein
VSETTVNQLLQGVVVPGGYEISLVLFSEETVASLQHVE